MALQYRVGRSLRRASLAPMRGKPSTIALPRPLDPKDGIIAIVGPTVDGIEVTIEFALLDEASALVLRMKVEYQGHAQVHLERAFLMSAGPTRNPLFSHKKSHVSREGEGHKPQKSHISGVRLFSIRTRSEEPQWLGDTLHISQGSGIKTWEISKSSLRAFLDYGRTTHGSAWLSLPGKLRSASVNGRSVSAGIIEPAITKIDIQPVQDVSLEISWSEASS